jgi:hypothetical protein
MFIGETFRLGVKLQPTGFPVQLVTLQVDTPTGFGTKNER